ncbi:MAG: hypothetical protein ACWA5R_05190 [bacterium]
MKKLLIVLCFLASQASHADPFRIDYGITGSWYNPELPGQGFSFEVIPDTHQFVAYWFTYQVDSDEQRWLFAQGEYSDDVANTNVFEPLGGIFLQDDQVTSSAWGEAVFTFTSCTEGSVSFESETDGSDTFSIVRITDNLACEGGDQP